MKNLATLLSTVCIFAMIMVSTPLFATGGQSITDNDNQNPEKVELKISKCEDQRTLSLSTGEELKDATIKVLDYKGKEIKSDVEYAGNKKNIITLNEFDTGLYFIDIKALNVNITFPVIIK